MYRGRQAGAPSGRHPPMLWNARPGDAVGHVTSADVGFSPAAGSYAEIRGRPGEVDVAIVGISRWTIVATLRDADGFIVTFIPDGALLASGGGLKNNQVKVLDVAQREPLAH